MRKYPDLAPVEFADYQDYHRQYNRAYAAKFKRVLVKVKLKKDDIALLRAEYERQGKCLESEVTAMLEKMVAKLRS